MPILDIFLLTFSLFALIFGLYWRVKGKKLQKRLNERDKDVDALMEELERLR